MKYWKKLSQNEIKNRVIDAVNANKNYDSYDILGLPASKLDDKVFSLDIPFVQNSAFLYALANNPNHIGCHTFGDSESYFSGTHQIEKELIKICSEDIFNAEADSIDGFVASGGTEANIQAIWIMRNMFRKDFDATLNEIAIICSEDTHYSAFKASNLLQIPVFSILTEPETKSISAQDLNVTLEKLKKQGIKYVAVVLNMMTTMFGSVDENIDEVVSVLKSHNLEYKIHIDGAYGGFFYPFTQNQTKLSFANPEILSISLDAHKMVQAPFGTGIFMIRKEMMKYAVTEQAQYVIGMDSTLIGSRSGANAIAVWMILQTYGPHGWFEKIHLLHYRTSWLEKKLREMEIKFYRNPFSNIITIQADQISTEIAKKFHLVSDNQDNPKWYKIVVMDHVTVDNLDRFVTELILEKN